MAKKQDRAVVAASTTETTPLISKDVEPQPKEPSWKPIHAILLCGFFVSLSFGVTQVPYVIPTSSTLQWRGCECLKKNTH